MRRLHSLIMRLPADSALARYQLGESADWSMEAELLAVVAELTHTSIRAQAANPQAITPLRIPRPYDTRPQHQPANANELAAFLHRNRSIV
jgi:hypothetical protein